MMRIHLPKILVNAFIVLTIILVLTFCFFLTKYFATRVQSEASLRIATFSSIHHTSIWIAESKGFFKKQGLRTELKQYDSGATAMKAMLENNEVDIVSTAAMPIVVQSFMRDDYAIFARTARVNNLIKILTREDQKIKVPQDLKNKKIGLTKGTVGDYFLGVLLKQNNMAISDVEVVDLPVQSLSQALIDKKVDAITTWEPILTQAKNRLGDNARLLPIETTQHEDLLFVAKKDFIKNNQKALVKFLLAINEGNTYILNHPLESINIASNRMNIDQIMIITFWPDYVFDLSITQSIFANLENQSRWFMENNLTSSKILPNYRRFYEPTILDSLEMYRQ